MMQCTVQLPHFLTSTPVSVYSIGMQNGIPAMLQSLKEMDNFPYYSIRIELLCRLQLRKFNFKVYCSIRGLTLGPISMIPALHLIIGRLFISRQTLTRSYDYPYPINLIFVQDKLRVEPFKIIGPDIDTKTRGRQLSGVTCS